MDTPVLGRFFFSMGHNIIVMYSLHVGSCIHIYRDIIIWRSVKYMLILAKVAGVSLF